MQAGHQRSYSGKTGRSSEIISVVYRLRAAGRLHQQNAVLAAMAEHIVRCDPIYRYRMLNSPRSVLDFSPLGLDIAERTFYDEHPPGLALHRTVTNQHIFRNSLGAQEQHTNTELLKSPDRSLSRKLKGLSSKPARASVSRVNGASSARGI
jgi:hypothetical protein